MLLVLFIAPVAALVGGATTSTITVAVKPPQVPRGVLRYEAAIGSKKCAAHVGPATPSCTLTGLAAGTQYNASASSIGDDYQISLTVFGPVNTLPNGKGLRAAFRKLMLTYA